MNWRKALTAGAVAGMLAISGCSSNVPENNLGNRNGIRLTESVARNASRLKAKKWKKNWNRNNWNRVNMNRRITRSRDSRARGDTVNGYMNRRVRNSQHSASAPMYRLRREANAQRLNRSTLRVPGINRTMPRRSRPIINRSRGRAGGLLKNNYGVRYKNYDFALSRNNKRYAEKQKRMNLPRKYRPMRNKYGALSNAYRKVKAVAAIDNTEAVTVMSMTGTSIRNIEPSVNVPISEIDGVINSLNKMRDRVSINPQVKRTRQPLRVSYKKGKRTRATASKSNRYGFRKPVATIYLHKGRVVKVEPGTSKIYSGTRMNGSRMSRMNKMNRLNRTRINRMPVTRNQMPYRATANTYNPAPRYTPVINPAPIVNPAPIINPNSFSNVIQPDFNSPVYRNAPPLNYAPVIPPQPVRRIMDPMVKTK
jgi:hypothetical protein